MRKLYIITAMLLGFIFFATAQDSKVILNEDFESGDTGGATGEYASYYDSFMPDGWTTISHYEGNEKKYRWHNYYSAKGSVSGLHAASCDAVFSFSEPDSETAFGPKEEILLTPELNLDDTYQLSFLWKSASASAIDQKEMDFQIRVIEVPASGEIDKAMAEAAETIWSFTDPAALKESGVTVYPWTGWTVYASTIDLSAWKGKKVKVAFVHKMLKKGANTVYLDNVKVQQFTPITAPQGKVNPTRYDFSSCYVGSKVYSDVFTLTNVGKGTLTITDIVSGSSDYSTTIAKEDVKLEKNDTYEFQIVCAPTLNGGNLNNTLTLKTNGGDITIQLQAIRRSLDPGYTFEGFEQGVPPTGWKANGWSATNMALEGDRSAYCSGGIDGGPYNLISPRLDLSTGKHKVSYRYYEQFESESGATGPQCFVKVYLSTDGGATWTQKFENPETGGYNTIINQEVDLGTPASDDCYIKWEYTNQPMSQDEIPELSVLFVDCVILPPLYGSDKAPEAATLLTPKNEATDVYTKNIVLSWEPTLFAESYKVYVGKSENDFSIVKGESTTKTSYTLAKADYATKYYWKVVPHNATGDAATATVWSFTTQADETVKTFPWNEGFEDEVFPPLGWQMTKQGYTDWDYSDINPFDGNHSALASAGDSNTETSLETPDFVLPAEDAQISFYWGNAVPVGLTIDETGLIQNTTTEADGIDACYFEVYADGKWTTLKMLSDKKKPYWMRERISLDAYKGKTVSFRWRYVATDFFKSSGVSLDNIVVEGTSAQKATFNSNGWDAEQINFGESVSSGNIFTLLNDGQQELTIESVTFSQAGFQSTLAAGTKIAPDAGTQFALTFTASQSGLVEDNMTVAFVGGYKAEFPVKVTVMPEDTRFFGFEGDEHGSLNPAGFTMIDVDKRATINMAMIDYPHYGEPFAFMVLDGVKCNWLNVPPVSGKHNLVAFGRDDYGAAEDWIVSAPMTATAESQFRFFGRNYASKEGSDFKASKVSVLVSTVSATDIASFEEVLEEKELPWPANSNDYTEYTVDLSKYAGQTIYVALRHTVTDGLAALFDDFYFEHFSYFGSTGIGCVEPSVNDITVYPNPVADMLYVDSETNADITVYSESGVVLKKQSGANSIDLSELKAGFYLLTVDNADGRHIARIIKK